MIKGILFDKDGTLLDFNATWIPPYLAAADYLAAQFPHGADAATLMSVGGYEANTRTWRAESALASASNQDIMNLWSDTIGDTINQTQRDHISHIFTRASADYVPAVDDMRGCLTTLRDRNIKLGIATMDDERAAKTMIDKLDLHGLFDFYCGADSGFGVKPRPGMMHAFAHHCGIKSGESIMVGDSPRDLHMGQNAGAQLTVGVLTGAHSQEMLAPHGDFVLQDIGELDALLNKLAM